MSIYPLSPFRARARSGYRWLSVKEWGLLSPRPVPIQAVRCAYVDQLHSMRFQSQVLEPSSEYRFEQEVRAANMIITTAQIVIAPDTIIPAVIALLP